MPPPETPENHSVVAEIKDNVAADTTMDMPTEKLSTPELSSLMFQQDMAV